MEQLWQSTQLGFPVALLLSAVSIVALIIFLIWFLTRQGAIGVLKWGTKRPVVLLILASLIPCLLVLLSNFPFPPDVGKALRLTGAGLGLVVGSSVILMLYQVQSKLGEDLEIVKRPALVSLQKGISIRSSAQHDRPLWKIAVSSDPHFDANSTNSAATERILQTISKGDYDAFLVLGDFVELGLRNSGWKKAVETLGAGLNDVPLLPVLGNHDALMGGQAHFQRLFPLEHSQPHLKTSFYDFFDLRTETKTLARFFILNLLWGAEAFDENQRAWFEEHLQETPAGAFKIVLSHCFFYSSGYSDERTKLPWYDHRETIPRVTPLFEKHAVDLAISGHNHHMEFLQKNGVAYAIVGTMGGKPAPAPSFRSEASIWMQHNVFGFLELQGFENQIGLSFKNPRGELLWSTELSCQIP